MSFPPFSKSTACFEFASSSRDSNFSDTKKKKMSKKRFKGLAEKNNFEGKKCSAVAQWLVL